MSHTLLVVGFIHFAALFAAAAANGVILYLNADYEDSEWTPPDVTQTAYDFWGIFAAVGGLILLVLYLLVICCCCWRGAKRGETCVTRSCRGKTQSDCDTNFLIQQPSKEPVLEDQMAEHMLQRCPLLQTGGPNVWPAAVQLHTKLNGSKEEVEKTATPPCRPDSQRSSN